MFVDTDISHRHLYKDVMYLQLMRTMNHGDVSLTDISPSCASWKDVEVVKSIARSQVPKYFYARLLHRQPEGYVSHCHQA